MAQIGHGDASSRYGNIGKGWREAGSGLVGAILPVNWPPGGEKIKNFSGSDRVRFSLQAKGGNNAIAIGFMAHFARPQHPNASAGGHKLGRWIGAQVVIKVRQKRS